MGFIAEGNTLNWPEAAKQSRYIRDHGIAQLLSIYKKYKDRKNDKLSWGDEIEYIIVKVDDNQKTARIALRANDVLQTLLLEEKNNPTGVETLWRPEYGRYMIEGTPGKPYCGLQNICQVESNMKKRRATVTALLNQDELPLTITNFPRLGCPGCSDPPSTSYPPTGPIAESQYLPDNIINPHFRFATLTANIRQRRGSNVKIEVPLFIDTKTDACIDQKVHTQSCSSENGASQNGHTVNCDNCKPNTIHMDAMGFGMGCCCLQCTFQCCNINEARLFYDQLAVMSPIMLALTAGTPIFKGLLSDIDARWNVISASVDDRTAVERGEVVGSEAPIAKSRYDSISTYISPFPALLPEYNDLDIRTDESTYKTLVDAGMDTVLAKHFAHLFIRDPLVIYEDKIALDDETHSDHFENIQSTNWQTVRFKPPPPGSPIGWRVEFRPMEVQFSDFENAAFCVFAVLLTRIISSFDLNLYMPLSLVDKNMQTAHKRDASRQEKFYFRKHITADHEGPCEYVLMTMNEIMNGNREFKGILPLMNIYLASAALDTETRTVITRYLSFISKRASGELLTPASWIRNFVQSHPEYKHDSVVTEEISYDLVRAVRDISEGRRREPTLLGEYVQ